MVHGGESAGDMSGSADQRDGSHGAGARVDETMAEAWGGRCGGAVGGRESARVGLGSTARRVWVGDGGMAGMGFAG